MTESVSSVQILLLKAQCYPFYFVDFDQEYELKDSVLVVKLIFPLIEIALLKSFWNILQDIVLSYATFITEKGRLETGIILFSTLRKT